MPLELWIVLARVIAAAAAGAVLRMRRRRAREAAARTGSESSVYPLW
jgi:hypothetical protein